MDKTNQQGIIASTKSAPAKQRKPKTIKDYIKVYEGEIAKALPSVMTPERFTRIVTTAVTNTPKLAECTPASFVGAMLNSAQLGLEPNTPLGQAYLIPYGKQCQFQIGYKGMLDLAYRSGEIKNVTCEAVHDNDDFDYQLGDDPYCHHKPALKSRGDVYAYYAVIKLKGGGEIIQVMSKEDVQTHAKKYSKAYSSGPWQTAFDEMAKKTVLKKALKYAPLKTDFVREVVQDETVKSFNSNAGADNSMSDAPDEFVINNETGEVESAG